VTQTPSIELSIVIPCRNEEDTLADVLATAEAAIAQDQLRAEIIVADNGSTDRSKEIAAATSARVIDVPEPGYGNALMGGIEQSRGEFILMGDADGSYDFGESVRFLEQYRKGYSLVLGCRLPSGGGVIVPGAMPPLHQWVGNPLLSALARLLFPIAINDIYCGLRGFSRKHFEIMNLKRTGMEFAVEMIVVTARLKAPTIEIPITLRKDGRVNTRSHLRTFRDGFRTIAFLLYSRLMRHPT